MGRTGHGGVGGREDDSGTSDGERGGQQQLTGRCVLAVGDGAAVKYGRRASRTRLQMGTVTWKRRKLTRCFTAAVAATAAVLTTAAASRLPTTRRYLHGERWMTLMNLQSPPLKPAGRRIPTVVVGAGGDLRELIRESLPRSHAVDVATDVWSSTMSCCQTGQTLMRRPYRPRFDTAPNGIWRRSCLGQAARTMRSRQQL